MTHLEEYNRIIESRKSNPLPEEQYGEDHHIVPKSICPILKDSKDNIVHLSAQEHFLAHYHLWLAYRDELHEKKWAKKMCYAFNQMKRLLMKCQDIELMARLYEEVRIEMSNILSENIGDKAFFFGHHHSMESKEKMRLAHLGKKSSEETRSKISQGNKGKHYYWFGKTYPEYARKKISKTLMGKKKSATTRNKMSKAMKGNKNGCGHHSTRGLHWYNNGKVNALAKSCPAGFVYGKLKRSK